MLKGSIRAVNTVLHLVKMKETLDFAVVPPFHHFLLDPLDSTECVLGSGAVSWLTAQTLTLESHQ